MTQNEPAPDTMTDLGPSLSELENLLRQYPPTIDLPDPTTSTSPQLPCPDFPNLSLDQPLPSGDVPLISSPSPSPPTPTSANPAQTPTPFHPCCRPACKSVLSEGCYYKDLAQQFAIICWDWRILKFGTSPHVVSPEPSQDCPYQKLLREGPLTYQVAQIGDIPFPIIWTS